jgi:hypothetical protein
VVHVGGSSETEEVKGEENTQGAGGGILSSMASRIGMAMSSANGNGNHHSAADDAKTSSGVDHRKAEEEKGGEANGGEILNTMAPKIGAAMSSANGNGDHRSAADDAKMSMSNGHAVDHVKGDEANGGGILSSVASKIGTVKSGADGEGNRARGGTGEDGKTSNGVTAGSGSKIEESGGLVDQIRSSLATGSSAKISDLISLVDLLANEIVSLFRFRRCCR